VAHVRRANKHGTAAELAENSVGYAGDGLSVFSHEAARSKAPARGSTRTMSLRERIKQQEHAFRELKIRFDRASEVERPKLQVQLGIKAKWLSTLWSELGAQKR